MKWVAGTLSLAYLVFGGLAFGPTKWMQVWQPGAMPNAGWAALMICMFLMVWLMPVVLGWGVWYWRNRESQKQIGELDAWESRLLGLKGKVTELPLTDSARQ